MEEGFLELLKESSLEIIIISLAVCALTMFLKWPIKKATSKLDEAKRKMVNSVILIIPLIIALVTCTVYFGLSTKIWFTSSCFQSSLSVWFLSLSIYAVISRFWILFKGVISGKIKINPDLKKEMVDFLKSNIKTFSKNLKINEKELSEIITKIESALALKQMLEDTSEVQDIEQMASIIAEIKQLKKEEINLQNVNQSLKTQIKNYSEQLFVKGETK